MPRLVVILIILFAISAGSRLLLIFFSASQTPFVFHAFFAAKSTNTLFLATNVVLLPTEAVAELLSALPFAFRAYSLLYSKGPRPLRRKWSLLHRAKSTTPQSATLWSQAFYSQPGRVCMQLIPHHVAHGLLLPSPSSSSFQPQQQPLPRSHAAIIVSTVLRSLQIIFPSKPSTAP